jgi:phenylalanyl-tRNA synthetase beta chain
MAKAFLGLDDKQYKLNSSDIAVADSKRVLALGGIIGGKETSITEKSTTIAFESANFDPIVIRKSAKKHALRTDASNRLKKANLHILLQ